MQTQAGECVEIADLLPDSFELRRLEDSTLRGGRACWVALGPTRVVCFAVCTAIIAEKYPNRVKYLLAYLRLIVKNCSLLVNTRFRRYVRVKPSSCINIRRALLDRCRGLGLRLVDCAWKLTMQPQSALCRCGAAVELTRRSYSGSILTVSSGGA